MRAEIVHYKDDLFGIWVHDIHQILDFLCPVYCGAVFPHAYMVCSAEQLYKGEYTDSTITNLLLQ